MLEGGVGSLGADSEVRSKQRDYNLAVRAPPGALISFPTVHEISRSNVMHKGSLKRTEELQRRKRTVNSTGLSSPTRGFSHAPLLHQGPCLAIDRAILRVNLHARPLTHRAVTSNRLKIH